MHVSFVSSKYNPHWIDLLQTLVIVDDLVVRKDHQKVVEADAPVRVARYKHFLIEFVHAVSSLANLFYGELR